MMCCVESNPKLNMFLIFITWALDMWWNVVWCVESNNVLNMCLIFTYRSPEGVVMCTLCRSSYLMRTLCRACGLQRSDILRYCLSCWVTVMKHNTAN
jgi:hypothetical protein